MDNLLDNDLHPMDNPLKSSPNDLKSFKDTLVWSDLKMVIEDRIEILQNKLIQANDHMEMIRLQEEVRAWKVMLGLPDFLIECALTEQQVKEEKQHA